MILAIDFDGTIVNDEFPEIGKLKDNAVDVINKLHAEGHYIILWTCRKDIVLKEAVAFLIKNGIQFDQINNDFRDLDFEPSRKIYADLYIDDKGINRLPDWNSIYKLVQEKSK